MPSFKKCCDIEEQGMRRLSQFFQANSATGYVTTGKGRLSRELQLTKGDVFLNNKAGEIIAIECKVEAQNKYGTFFIEEWSNLNPEQNYFKRGWMEHLDADQLLYFFLDTGELFCIPFPKLKAWCYRPNENTFANGGVRYTQSIEGFPLLLQWKNDQLNKTYGRSVRFSAVKANVGFKKYIVDESGNFKSSDAQDDDGQMTLIGASQGNFWEHGR